MPFIVRVFSEYDMTCDICGTSEVLHSVDVIDDEVVNSHNCIRLAGYHRSHGLILCDECFRKKGELI